MARGFIRNRSVIEHALIVSGLLLCLVLPSSYLIIHYFGPIVFLAYLIVVAVVLTFLFEPLQTILLKHVDEKYCLLLALLTVLVLIMVFAVVYPALNSGKQLWFLHLEGGGDRDEALNSAVTELVNGRYPYYPKTYLGNPITPLPGSLVLAIPFVLLGNSAYQNFFWLIALFLVLRSDLRDGRKGLLFFWMIVLLCPGAFYELMSGGDLLANSIFVTVFVLFALKSIPDETASSRRKLVAAVLLGIGLSSRANFLLVIPVLFFAILRRTGQKTAVIYLAVTCATFAGITLPFYVFDPNGFSPLHVTSLIGGNGSSPLNAGLLALTLIGILSVFLPFRRGRNDESFVVLNCAITQAAFVLGFAALLAVDDSLSGLRFMNFGIMFLIFGALASGRYLSGMKDSLPGR
jgi:hypothetical protein